MLGNANDAFEAVLGWDTNRLTDIELVGSGESRVVWRFDDQVVYKVGGGRTNQYEHEALTAWRRAGALWAPETALHHVEVNRFGCWEPFVVLAMAYLPDDGTTPDPDTFAEIRRAAPQVAWQNVHVCRGQTWLIDEVDIEVMPDLGTETTNV